MSELQEKGKLTEDGLTETAKQQLNISDEGLDFISNLTLNGISDSEDIDLEDTQELDLEETKYSKDDFTLLENRTGFHPFYADREEINEIIQHGYIYKMEKEVLPAYLGAIREKQKKGEDVDKDLEVMDYMKKQTEKNLAYKLQHPETFTSDEKRHINKAGSIFRVNTKFIFPLDDKKLMKLVDATYAGYVEAGMIHVPSNATEEDRKLAEEKIKGHLMKYYSNLQDYGLTRAVRDTYKVLAGTKKESLEARGKIINKWSINLATNANLSDRVYKSIMGERLVEAHEPAIAKEPDVEHSIKDAEASEFAPEMIKKDNSPTDEELAEVVQKSAEEENVNPSDEETLQKEKLEKAEELKSQKETEKAEKVVEGVVAGVATAEAIKATVKKDNLPTDEELAEVVQKTAEKGNQLKTGEKAIKEKEKPTDKEVAEEGKLKEALKVIKEKETEKVEGKPVEQKLEKKEEENAYKKALEDAGYNADRYDEQEDLLEKYIYGAGDKIIEDIGNGEKQEDTVATVKNVNGQTQVFTESGKTFTENSSKIEKMEAPRPETVKSQATRMSDEDYREERAKLQQQYNDTSNPYKVLENVSYETKDYDTKLNYVENAVKIFEKAGLKVNKVEDNYGGLSTQHAIKVELPEELQTISSEKEVSFILSNDLNNVPAQGIANFLKENKSQAKQDKIKAEIALSRKIKELDANREALNIPKQANIQKKGNSPRMV